MRIKWQGDTWAVKYYPDGYARWTLENGNTSVSWLVNDENNFTTQKQFIKFLREREKENHESN